MKHNKVCLQGDNLKFKQIWPDQGDWNCMIQKAEEPLCRFKQIWPDQGDWNYIIVASPCWDIVYLNKFDPIKGIETFAAIVDKLSLSSI